MVQFVENEVKPNQTWRVPRGPPRRVLLAHLPDVPIYLSDPNGDSGAPSPPPKVLKTHMPEALQGDLEVYDPGFSEEDGPTALDLLVSSGHAKEVNVSLDSLKKKNFVESYKESSAQEENSPAIDAWHPSLSEKIEAWWDTHADKIPLVSFFKTMHDQVDYARKASIMEAAETGKTWKADVDGLLTGLMVDATVNLPGFLADSMKSIWDSAPAEHTTRTGFHVEGKKDEVITLHPDDEIKDQLLLARYAPNAYKAEERLNKATQLSKQMEALNEKASQLNLELESLKALGQKASQNPDLIPEYNKKVLEFNKKAEELNQEAKRLEMEWNALDPEGAEQELKEFYKRLNRASLGYSIGENIGSMIGLGLVGETATGLLKEGAPETIVIKEFSFPEKYFDADVKRMTRKTTVYKGWFNKKPVETVYDTLLKSGDEILFQKSFHATPEDVLFRMSGRDTREWFMNKLYSRKELEPTPHPKIRRPISPAEFEQLTGKPFPVGVKKIGWPGDLGREFKVGDQVMDIFFPGADPTIDLDEPVKVFKTLLAEEGKPSKTLSKKFSGYKPKFNLGAEEKPIVLTPEDWDILNKLTQATKRVSGKKWVDFSRSGNVAQTFYDPPLQALETETELLTSGAKKISPDLSNFKFSMPEAYSTAGKPFVGVPNFSIGMKSRQVSGSKRHVVQTVETLQLEDTIQALETALAEDSAIRTVEDEMDIVKLKRELRRKFGQRFRSDDKVRQRPIDLGGVRMGPLEAVVDETQVQIQKVKPIEVQLETVRERMTPPRLPKSLRVSFPPKPPLTNQKTRRKKRWDSLDFEIKGWTKKLKEFDFGGSLADLEKGLKF